MVHVVKCIGIVNYYSRTHVSRTVSSCFAVLRQLRSIRRSVSPAVLQSLVVSLVLSSLDYGNATLAGLPGNQLDRLQSVINAAARLNCLLCTKVRRHNAATPRPSLVASARTAPPYLANELCRVADVEAKKTAAFCVNVCSRNAVIASFDDW